MVHIERDDLPEGVWPIFVDRLADGKGDVLTQSDFTGTITLLIYDRQGTDPSTAIHTESGIVVTSVIFNTLQTDGYWSDKDKTGYNFRYTFDLTNLAAGTTLEGGHTYRCEFQGTGSTIGPVRWLYDVTVRSAQGD